MLRRVFYSKIACLFVLTTVTTLTLELRSGIATAQESKAAGGEAATATSTEADMSADGQESAFAVDVAFDKFVDVSLLRNAIVSRNSSALTDGALALAEGERILQRSHHGATASRVLNLAVEVSGRSGDKTSLERLERHAKATNNTELSKQVGRMLQFAAAPRAALPKIELPNPTEQEREVVAMVNEDLEQAARHGSAAQADEIAAYVKENRKAETITAATELALLNQIATAKKSLPAEANAAADKEIDDVLSRLSGAARGSIPSGTAPPKNANGLYNCSGQAVRLSLAWGKHNFDKTALHKAAVDAARKTGGGSFPWDDKWYTRLLADKTITFLMIAHNTKTCEVRWTAIKNGEKWWVMKDNGVIKNPTTYEQVKHSIKMNGWPLDFDVYNPKNSGSITADHIYYGFGY